MPFVRVPSWLQRLPSASFRLLLKGQRVVQGLSPSSRHPGLAPEAREGLALHDLPARDALNAALSAMREPSEFGFWKNGELLPNHWDSSWSARWFQMRFLHLDRDPEGLRQVATLRAMRLRDFIDPSPEQAALDSELEAALIEGNSQRAFAALDLGGSPAARNGAILSRTTQWASLNPELRAPDTPPPARRFFSQANAQDMWPVCEAIAQAFRELPPSERKTWTWESCAQEMVPAGPIFCQWLARCKPAEAQWPEDFQLSALLGGWTLDEIRSLASFDFANDLKAARFALLAAAQMGNGPAVRELLSLGGGAEGTGSDNEDKEMAGSVTGMAFACAMQSSSKWLNPAFAQDALQALREAIVPEERLKWALLGARAAGHWGSPAAVREAVKPWPPYRDPTASAPVSATPALDRSTLASPLARSPDPSPESNPDALDMPLDRSELLLWVLQEALVLNNDASALQALDLGARSGAEDLVGYLCKTLNRPDAQAQWTPLARGLLRNGADAQMASQMVTLFGEQRIKYARGAAKASTLLFNFFERRALADALGLGDDFPQNPSLGEATNNQDEGRCGQGSAGTSDRSQSGSTASTGKRIARRL